MSSEPLASSPDEAIRLWKMSRKLKPVRLDERRKTISILFLCDNCWRAIYAEKQLMRMAEGCGVGARLLVLSAGFNTKPGAAVPREIIEQAEKRGVDLTEQKPCAAFKFRDDIYMHDYIICLDRRIRDKVLLQAEEVARSDNEDYTLWESKIRLIKDLGGDASLTKSSWELDISKFNTIDNETVMGDIEKGCDAFLTVLRDRGL